MEFKMKICYTYFRFMIVRFLEMVFAMQKCEQIDWDVFLKKRNTLYPHKHE